jgi:hypothetical protein
MRWFRIWLAVGACSLLQGAACNVLEGHSCTEIGCGEGVGVNVRPVGGTWPAGAYRLELGLDDVAGTCDFTVPEDLPAMRGSATSLTCLDGATLLLQQIFDCRSISEGGAVSQTCEPVADQYELTLSAFGTPTTLTLVLTRDGEELVSENRELTYTESRPNGPDCEPVCRQAQAELSF